MAIAAWASWAALLSFCVALLAYNVIGEVKFALAANVRPDRFRKNVRGPKKPAPKRVCDKKHPHVSAARILAKSANKKGLFRAQSQAYYYPRSAPRTGRAKKSHTILS